MPETKELESLLAKVEKATHKEKLDLSSDEDLAVAVMNLISIEEHLFFSAEKTGKNSYILLLEEVREMRKSLLKKLIREYEGEVWCISKHLLASSMRLIEVGTKRLNRGEREQANQLFGNAYKLWDLFWGLNLGLIPKNSIPIEGKTVTDSADSVQPELEIETSAKKPTFFNRLSEAIKKAVDCCIE